MKEKVNFFWFRRDLRFIDNTGLIDILKNKNIIPIFIFDIDITKNIDIDDARINFIYENLFLMNNELKKVNSSILVKKGKVIDIWKNLIFKYDIKNVSFNKDYEPYAIERDSNVKELFKNHNIEYKIYKDQVIYEENEIVKNDGRPYTVFTPYKNKWLKKFKEEHKKIITNDLIFYDNFYKSDLNFPTLKSLGFKKSKIRVKPYSIININNYSKNRDFPYLDKTSRIGPYLRFGIVSIRKLVKNSIEVSDTYLSELIWREFFMQILFNFPNVVDKNFKPKYDNIKWLNNSNDFEKWKNGNTGYPIVDAGMRELNETGYMHNRVRMITAGFLCKHLLTDWRYGEKYFAKKLLDFELSSNNGNWQWAAGTGCDSAPYFRIFNPFEQRKKFDPDFKYTKKWVKELGTKDYSQQIIDHKIARTRAIKVYKEGLSKSI